MAEGVEIKVFSAKTLYELSASAAADNFHSYEKYLAYLPENVLFDLYYQLYKERKLCLLGMELSNLETFTKLLKVTNRRVHLLQIFQALMDHRRIVKRELALSYTICSLDADESPDTQDKMINLGLKLSGFFSDAGWYSDSEQVLLTCTKLCLYNNTTPENLCRTLDCYHKLLHAQASYCAFQDAAVTFELAMGIVKKLKDAGYENVNHAALFAEFSALFFMRNEYDQSYRWSIEALKQLKPTLPVRITIDVLRQAAKSCTIKRKFQKAELLIRQAIYLTREAFGTDHPKYSDVLTDYGFFLLSSDSIANSVTVYKTALKIRKAIFGNVNLHVALAHDNLAYACYIYEYSSGMFYEASDHVRKAIDIMEKLLPADHLMLANAKKVKALLLEEIALQNVSILPSENTLLLRSEDLQLFALQVTKNTFGERNVQTAKLYGNLGRLYQSMRKFQNAEAMHLKAISIKEDLLGPDDYDVGMSIGHLASLYNYHMKRYREAEKLYYRSIAISLKLFGKSFSGLEYDYRGLLHVYMELNEHEKVLECIDTLNQWKELRDENAQTGDTLIELQKCPEPIEDVINVFFSM